MRECASAGVPADGLTAGPPALSRSRTLALSHSMIDLRSDTVTKPSAAMRQAMANAEVGDDERDGDPTTAKLEALVATLLGKEAEPVFPSGGMANQAAVWVQAPRATEVFVDQNSHVLDSEIAGVAALSGA